MVLPAVSFECSDGPSEIIRNGVDGILVPPEDMAGLTAVLDRLMAGGEDRQRLALHAPEALERFGQERVMRIWETVIKHVVGNTGSHRDGRSRSAGELGGQRETRLQQPELRCSTAADDELYRVRRGRH